mmetsp:Transcript_20884/g.33205  ORF Transcript_20884/g.33205 Transcript_20884/m.33205 type:complete len:515 (+) Transcript_20884:25-1569(+)
MRPSSLRLLVMFLFLTSTVYIGQTSIWELTQQQGLRESQGGFSNLQPPGAKGIASHMAAVLRGPSHSSSLPEAIPVPVADPDKHSEALSGGHKAAGSAGAALHWSGEVAAIPIQPFGTGPDANGLPAASGMERLRRSPFATERLQQGTAAALDHAAAVSRGSGPRANVHTEVVGGGPLYGIVDNARRPAPAAPAPLRTTPHVSLRPITCLMSTWKPWTQCSKSCAGGVQSRGRVILRRPSGGGDVCPALAESRSCNEQPCHKEGHRKSKARPTPRPLQRDVAVEQFTPETFENGPLTPEGHWIKVGDVQYKGAFLAQKETYHLESVSGGHFTIEGMVGEIYNIITDAYIQVNAKYVSVNPRGRTVFWGEVGIQLMGHQFLFCGNDTLYFRGAPVTAYTQLLLPHPKGYYVRKYPNGLAVRAFGWLLLFRCNGKKFKGGKSLNYVLHKLQVDPADPPKSFAPHGILGQTFALQLPVQPRDHMGSHLEGRLSDYKVKSIWGTESVFNRYSVRPLPF